MESVSMSTLIHLRYLCIHAQKKILLTKTIPNGIPSTADSIITKLSTKTSRSAVFASCIASILKQLLGLVVWILKEFRCCSLEVGS